MTNSSSDNEEPLAASRSVPSEQTARVSQPNSNMAELKVGLDVPKLADYDNYECYKDMVLLWQATTNHPKSKHGAYLVTGIPNKHKTFGNNLQETILLKIRPAELATDPKSIDKVIEFLDGILGKTLRSYQMQLYSKVHYIRRTANQNIADYIREFDLYTTKCKNKNVDINSNIKTFILLLGAGLTTLQHEILKGVVDAATDDELYEKVKEKLIGMLTNSWATDPAENEKSNVQNVELSDTFFAENEEAFVTWQTRKKQFQKAKQNKFKKSSSAQMKTTDSNHPASNLQARNNDVNPKDYHGRIYKCRECGSFKHLYRECPYVKGTFNRKQAFVGEHNEGEGGYVTEPESDEDNSVQKVFLTNDKKELNRFTAESLNSAALDTCCTSSVAGEKWMQIYLNAIPKHLKDRIKGPFSTGTEFTFGNNQSLVSGKAYKVPIIIGQELYDIIIDVIPSDIPLLLSKGHMKQIGISLNMTDDTATANGKPLKVSTTSAGHFIVSLLGDNDQEDTMLIQEIMAADLITANEKKVFHMLDKVHRQLGHRPKRVFIETLKSAEQWKESFGPMVDKIIDGCQGCLLRKRNPDRPVVALCPSKDFNEVVGLDLKIRKGRPILYAVDTFTRYTQGTYLKSKDPSEVVKGLMRIWIRYFGKMKELIFDNGGEFSNNIIMEVCSQLDIKIHTTGSSSPWQNGTTERHHAVVDDIHDSVEEDFPELDSETALAWSCSAKNSLSNVYGYTPYELVFGRKPHVTDIVESPPTALEIKSHCKTFEDNMKAMTSAKSAFMKAQNSEKLKRALRSKMRTAEYAYQPGDWCYYRRDKDGRWMGPAKVMWQDSKVIMIRHGGYCVRVSANRILPVKEELRVKIEAGEIPGADLTRDHLGNPINKDPSENKRVSEDNTPHETTTAQDISFQTSVASENTTTETPIETSTASDHNEVTASNEVTEEAANDNDEIQVAQENVETHERRAPGRPSKTQKKASKQPLFKPPERIQIRMNNEWRPGMVTSRAGKATAKTSENWYNVQLDDGTKFHDDMSKYEVRKVNEEAQTVNWVQHEVLAVMVPKEKQDSHEAKAAKQQELDKLKEFNTYEIVDDIGQERITTVWVLTEKGTEVRARLTARGFQESTDVPTESPTMHKSSLRLALGVAAANGWSIGTTDIRSAFLQGSDLDREVYVQPPKEAYMEGKLWRLNKCLYGLKDASRKWNNKVDKKLKQLGFKQCSYDFGFYYLVKDGVLQGFVGLHVDDFIHSGNRFFCKKILPQLRACFKIGKEESKSFMYTGFQLNQDEEGITLDQKHYVDNITIPSLEASKLSKADNDLNEDELTLLRQMVGVTNWTVRATRPDLSYEMIFLSTKFKKGKISDLKYAKKVLLRLKDTAHVRIPAMNLEKAELYLYTDASLGNLNETLDSTAAYILFMVEPNSGKCFPLDWKANKNTRIVTSTLGAEALSLYIGLDAAIATRWLLRSMLGERYKFPLRAIIDNKDTYDAVHSTTNIAEKRLRREIGMIKESLSNGDLSRLVWVKGEHQLSDALTKKGTDTLKLRQVVQTGKLSQEQLEAAN